MGDATILSPEDVAAYVRARETGAPVTATAIAASHEALRVRDTTQSEHVLPLEEGERQLVVMALALLSLDRPGFDDTLNTIAQRIDNRRDGRAAMYDAFRATLAPLPVVRRDMNQYDDLRAKLAAEVAAHARTQGHLDDFQGHTASATLEVASLEAENARLREAAEEAVVELAAGCTDPPGCDDEDEPLPPGDWCQACVVRTKVQDALTPAERKEEPAVPLAADETLPPVTPEGTRDLLVLVGTQEQREVAAGWAGCVHVYAQGMSGVEAPPVPPHVALAERKEERDG
jgi:hypothetical protein